TLHSGADPADGLAQVARGLAGPAAERLRPVIARATMGATPRGAWAAVAGDDVLAPLGRALLRSHRTGASVVQAVEQLADELEGEQHASAEDRARRVGVLAAVPLGVCLLPAFLLIGIVPTVASMLAAIAP
ncbi:MAG: type II secretion system F family protein, partial [Nocardioides sp.]|nr:type II secretion system F family protein [Nocardioides sp.]